MHRVRRSFCGVGLAALLCALAAPALSAPAAPAVGEMVVSGAFVEWMPVTDYERVVLRVSGPEGFSLREEFPGGVVPSLSLFGLGGNPLADGIYKYELRTSPVIDAASRVAMQAAREADDLAQQADLLSRLPRGEVQSGSFSIDGGAVVPWDHVEPQPQAATRSDEPQLALRATVLTLNDGVVYNSLCVGFDCSTSPSFSDTTVLLIENNTRLKFDDTSSSPYPRNDWEIEANSNASGGLSYLAINDCGLSSQGGCATDPVFLVEAGAPVNSLYVDAVGRVGLGTSTPSVEIHVVDGDTPTLRLDQDGSSSFGTQTWDVAGNETSFFIRDVSGGMTYPFRIFPGAGSSSLAIAADNDIGIGTISPSEALDIHRSGAVRIQLSNTSAGTDWNFANDANGDFAVSRVGSGGNDLEIERDGDIGNCGNPDHDFVISSGSSCVNTPRSWIDAGATSFSTSSSRTYKENLEPLHVDGILEKVRGVGVYSYDFIDGPADRIGLLAEDFHTIFGRGSDKELSGHELQLALWLAVQELAEQNDVLRQELEALKGER